MPVVRNRKGGKCWREIFRGYGVYITQGSSVRTVDPSWEMVAVGFWRPCPQCGGEKRQAKYITRKVSGCTAIARAIAARFLSSLLPEYWLPSPLDNTHKTTVNYRQWPRSLNVKFKDFQVLMGTGFPVGFVWVLCQNPGFRFWKCNVRVLGSGFSYI